MSFRWPRIGCTIVVAALAASCATHPYVPLEEISVGPSGEVPLGRAVDYANSARARYERALIAEAERQGSVANGLIVLGAVALGLAALDAHRDSLVVAGLAGGTAYTLGSWNQSRPREQAYVEGMKAMSCAIDAIMPLNIGREDRAALEADLKGLADRIDALNRHIALVEIALAAGDADAKPEAALISAAQGDVASAKALAITADEALVAGRRLLQESGRAGLQLVNAVNRIGTLVTDAVRGTRADLAALPEVIRGLAKSGEIFVPGLGAADALASAMGKGAAPVPAEPSLQGTRKQVVQNNLRAALAELKVSAQLVASQTRRIGMLVQAVNSAKPVEKLKACNVQIDASIQVSPGQVSFVEKRAAEKRVVIAGGTKPYRVAIHDKPVPIELREPLAGDSSFAIVATDKTAAGESYTVHVTDATGQSKEVKVVIAPGEPQKKDGGDNGTDKPAAQPAPQSTPGSGKPAAISKDDIEAVQAALCQKVDGKLGKKTRLAIEIFQDQSRVEVDSSKVTAEQLQKMQESRGSCVSDRRNSYEKGLAGGEIAQIREKLGLKDGKQTIDENMRKRLSALQLPESFASNAANTVAVKAQKEGQLTLKLRRNYLDTL